MNILICDDEREITEQLSSMILERYKLCNIYTSDSSEAIVQLLSKNNLHFDIIFMDIVLKKESGIDAFGSLFEDKTDSKIIFISGYPEKVPSIFFKVKPFGFINKPIDKELVYRYIEKAISEIESNQKYICCNEAGKEIRIPFSHIVFIESIGRKLRIKTENSEFFTYGKLDEIENIPASFVRCHKSFIVNMKYIESFSKHRFTMKDKKEINISRSRQDEAESKYYFFRGGII